MRRIILNSLYFILPIVVLIYPVDLILSYNLRKVSSGEFSTWNALIDGKVDSDIVIYGSSRAWVQIDPTMIADSLSTTTYNLGIDGHNFWLQNLRHSLLLKNNKKPKLIIHSLDIFTLDKNKELFDADQFLPYMLGNDEIMDATISYIGYKPIDYKLPLVRYYGKSSVLFKLMIEYTTPVNLLPKRQRGYRARKELWNLDLEKARKKMGSYTAKLDTPSIKLFEKYIVKCKADSIKLIFVYAPEYIEGQKFVKNRNEILGLYRQLSKKYSIPFYDFSNDEMSFNKKYFYNSSHLNKLGAELFTAKLINLLRIEK